MRGKISGGFQQVAWFALVFGAACEATDRPPLDREAKAAAETAAANNQDAARESANEPSDPPPDENGAAEPVENAPPVASLDPGDSVGGQSGGMANETCSGDAGTCDDASAAPVCVPTGPRDCSSDLDNDCDGRPDNAVDDVCVCAPGSVEPCEEHPGLDGRGQCQAGSRTCIIGEGNLSSDWGACEGSVGPGEQDSCSVAGDDTDCDGTDNGGCPCVDGQTQPCGPNTENGICQLGVQTCVNARFGECQGAVFPAARNCGSQQDNDCDGRPDDTIDNVCTCAIGSVQACGTHPGRDGNGQCRAGSQRCEARANNTTSSFGSCSGSVGPAAQDSCAAGNDGNCTGTANEGCACINGVTRQCGSTDTGACSFGTQTCVNGNFGQCQGAVSPGRRNCGSAQDNDCDGRPDNTIDSVCTCAIGTSQVCGAHPGQDGNGQCRAGQRQCAVGANNASTGFGACTGSVGPAAQDSCTTLGNDANCDGAANGGCACIAGQGNGPCRGNPNAPRCNGQGQCVQCQTDGDCSLVSGGRDVCSAGQCIQGDTEPPVSPSSFPTFTVVDSTSFRLSFFLSTDNQTATAAIEYAVFYANPLETSVLSGAVSPEAILTLTEIGEVVTARPFGVLGGAGGSGTILVRLPEPLAQVEVRIVTRDEAGNMDTYVPIRVVF